MDQLKSSEKKATVVLPKRKISMELLVGAFTLVSVLCAAYLAIGLGDLEIGMSGKYDVYAEFDDISGLKNGASVEIAGVQIGSVVKIALNDPRAVVTMRLVRPIQLRTDDIAMIRTKGIIGDRYIQISRGAAPTFVEEGGKLFETESVVDLEKVIGAFVHNLSNDEKKSE